MKKTITSFLMILTAVLAFACTTNPVDDSIAKKVSEFAASMNEYFEKAWAGVPDVVAPVCKSDGLDLVIVYDVKTVTEVTEEDAINDDNVHYPYFKDLIKYTGSDSVRMLIQYVANDEILRTHTIDKAYKPTIEPIEIIDSIAEPANAMDSDLYKYYNDNYDRIAADYKELFEGASGPNCYIEYHSLVLEYKFFTDITRQQFFEIIDEKAARLKTVADELTEAVRGGYAELIIRCFDINGEKLLDYTVGRLFTLGES